MGGTVTRAPRQGGFTLIETVFALAIMAGGLLSLAAVFSYGMLHLTNGESLLVAKEKAAEAIESVFMSREPGVITWNQVRNQSQGGIFQDGAQAIQFPGADGVVGTADDDIESLAGFTREIEIIDINANLREIRVVVTYPFGDGTRELVLLTYISAFA